MVQEGAHYSACMLPEVVKVVATFLHNDDFVANPQQLPGHIEVAQRAESAPTELVVDGRIEATGDHDQIRRKFADHWKKYMVTGTAVLVVAEHGDSIVLA